MANLPRTPPRAGANRKLIEARLADLGDDRGETVSVELRGTPVHLPVITVPAWQLYLNPLTHRVRALRDSFGPTDNSIEAAPWSEGAQNALANMLKATPADASVVDPAYNKLAADLAQYGQNEPGIVTRDGVVVDGNTRRVALIEKLGQQAAMRVAVLPASVGWSDIVDIELAIQLRKDRRREYSFVNRLVAVAEQFDEGAAPGVDKDLLPGLIAAKFRSTGKQMLAEHWMYGLLVQLMQRSRVGRDRLTLSDFEQKSEHLRELSRALKNLSRDNKTEVEIMRETRLAAIMLGFSKTDVRYVDVPSQFYVRFLADRLPPELRPGDDEKPVEIPGLGKSVAGASSTLVAARKLLDAVLQSMVDRERSAELDQLRSIMEDAMKEAGQTHRQRKTVTAAPERMLAAAESLRHVSYDIAIAKSRGQFDAAVVDEAVGQLRNTVENLAAALADTPDQGKNVQWLVEKLAKDR